MSCTLNTVILIGSLDAPVRLCRTPDGRRYLRLSLLAVPDSLGPEAQTRARHRVLAAADALFCTLGDLRAGARVQVRGRITGRPGREDASGPSRNGILVTPDTGEIRLLAPAPEPPHAFSLAPPREENLPF